MGSIPASEIKKKRKIKKKLSLALPELCSGKLKIAEDMRNI